MVTEKVRDLVEGDMFHAVVEVHVSSTGTMCSSFHRPRRGEAPPDRRGRRPAQRVARAIRWLREHFAEPLRVETLAKHVGMSPSALHLHFKSMTALSPLQYQKRSRLQEARRLMVGEGLDAGEAAFRVGYESPSQFGREYRRMFGAPPKQDVAALKGDARPASYAGV